MVIVLSVFVAVVVGLFRNAPRFDLTEGNRNNGVAVQSFQKQCIFQAQLLSGHGGAVAVSDSPCVDHLTGRRRHGKAHVLAA